MTDALYLTTDLMFSSRVAGAANAAGVKLADYGSVGKILELARETPPRVVVVDMDAPKLDIADFVTQLKQLEPPPAVVAYGSHVHVAKLEAASAAGCDAVLTRGQFNSQMVEVLARFAG